jgi:hypothetical protein
VSVVPREPVFDRLEAICPHHDISAFRCAADAEYELWLQIHHNRSAKPLGDRVLVAVHDELVVGFMSSVDVSLSPSFGRYAGLHFFIGSAAVSDTHRGMSIFAALAREMLESVRLVEDMRSVTYKGVLTQPGANVRLQRALKAIGFHPIEGTTYWVKLRPAKG